MPGTVKASKMSQVSHHPHHHQSPGISSQSNTTNGPPQTSQGPPGHYIGGNSGSSSTGGGSYGSSSRRINFVEGALRRSMSERQDSFGHLGLDGDMYQGSRASGISLADDILASHRRDSLRDEPSTAALDAAILDLTRRRLNMAATDPAGAGGRDHHHHSRWERSSISYAHSASSLAARQQQLQAQQRELEQRQRELEIQRQQLMAGMQEHAKSTSLFAAQHGLGSMNSSQQQWWVCQVCNSKAFASHDEAMQHEISCCPEPHKYDAMAGAMPIPSDHHMGGLGAYPISPGFDTGLEVVSVESFSEMKEPMPLAMASDKDWLTPLHCFVRKHCVQLFTASEDDVSTPSKGKRKPIQVGQVGIRCPHCHSEESKGKTRERGSVYYPTSISSIYNATMNLLQRHLHNCSAVPAEIMRRYETLKSDDARSGTSKRYWIESSLSLGLVDTPNGIRYSAVSPPPLPSLSSQQHSTGSYNIERRNSNDFFSSSSNAVADLNQEPEASGGTDSPSLDSPDGASNHEDGSVQDAEQSLTDSAPLVTPEDEPYSTKFSFLLIGQMQPCVFTEADRLGKRKGLPAGFPGLACRHCFGGYGSGRFFPSSIKTLSDTSKTLNVLHNHMMRCRKCPQEVRESLEKLRVTHDEERGKMKFGSQKAFFARVWERLHKNASPGVPPKRKASIPPGDYSRLPATAPLPYMDHSRYFGPPITAPDNMSMHHSFSAGMDLGRPIDFSDSKRRRSG